MIMITVIPMYVHPSSLLTSSYINTYGEHFLKVLRTGSVSMYALEIGAIFMQCNNVVVWFVVVDAQCILFITALQSGTTSTTTKCAIIKERKKKF